MCAVIAAFSLIQPQQQYQSSVFINKVLMSCCCPKGDGLSLREKVRSSAIQGIAALFHIVEGSHYLVVNKPDVYCTLNSGSGSLVEI